MSGVLAFQDYWVTGSRFYFRRDDDANNALIDLGTVGTTSPSIEATTIELKDGDGGRLRTVAEEVTEINESYEVECRNIAGQSLAVLFMSTAPASFTQPTDLSAVPHKGVIGPGRFVKLHAGATDKSAFVYSVATVVVKGSGGMPTYVKDTDYIETSLERGIIEIQSGGSITDGLALEIDLTLNALTGDRLISPQSVGSVKGDAFLVWGRKDNTRQTVREFRATLSTNATNFQIEDYSSFTIQAQVLSDITDLTKPAGRLLSWLGALPVGKA